MALRDIALATREATPEGGIRRLQGRIGSLQRRQSELQGDLDRKRAQLDALPGDPAGQIRGVVDSEESTCEI